MITLTKSQSAALDALIAFATDTEPGFSLCTLEGYAGTGKTTLVGHLLPHLSGLSVAVMAPTNKAVGVLQEKIAAMGEGFALSGVRHALNKVAVHRGPDAEGEEVGRAEVLADDVEDLPIGTDVAIGGHHEGARDARHPRQAQGAAHGAAQLGAAAAVLGTDEGQGLLCVFGGGVL